MQSFLLGRKLRASYAEALGLGEVDNGTPPRTDNIAKPSAAPRARSPTERININCYPTASATDSGLGIAIGLVSGDAAALSAALSFAIMEAGRGLSDLMLDCTCRVDGLLIGTVDCAAACLGIDGTFPKIPSINVRGEEIHSVSQHKICSGWRDWLWELYSDESWQETAQQDFKAARDAMKEILGGQAPLFRSAPDGDCLGCLAGNASDWNWLLLEQSVWENVVAHDTDSRQYVETMSNIELLEVLQPAAEYALKV